MKRIKNSRAKLNKINRNQLQLTDFTGKAKKMFPLSQKNAQFTSRLTQQFHLPSPFRPLPYLSLTFMRQILLALLSIAFMDTLLAQQELSLHFMDKTVQRQYTNPAFMAPAKVTVTLPGAQFGFSNTAFNLHETIVDSSDGNRYLNPGIINKLNDNDYILFNGDIDFLNITIRPIKKLQIGLGSGVHTRTTFYYPSDLLKFGWNGNSGRLNETISLAPRFDLTSYIDISLRAALTLPGDKLTIGAAAKYLQGIYNASNDKNRSTATFTTLDEQQYIWRFESDYRVNVAGPGVSNVTTVDSFIKNLTPQTSLQNFKAFQNNGFAVDLGATYKLTEKLTLAASIIDLGTIRWKDAGNFTSKGSYEFQGLDAGSVILGDSINPQVIVDSLAEIFKFTKTSDSYTSVLPTKYYLSGQYQVLKVLRVGGLIYGESFQGKIIPAAGINANIDIKRFFSVGLMYAYRNRSFANLGANIALKTGPVQVFMASDNILAMINPFYAQNVNIRFGMNLCFGKIKED